VIRRPRRTSLLTRFGIVSFVLLALLGGVLVAVVLGSVGTTARAKAVEQGRFAAYAGPALTSTELQQGFVPLDASRIAQLRARFTTVLGSTDVVRTKIWNDEHWIVYSDTDELVDRWFAPDDELTDALDGRATSTVSSLSGAENVADGGHGSRLVSVYLPIRLDDSGALTEDATRPVVGAFEIYIAYQPIFDRELRRGASLVAIIIGGLAVLYLALFRLVASASRRLQRQAAQNRHQATHDALTDLANRVEFTDRLEIALARSRTTGRRTAVLLVDLDRFKEVNDTLGHGSGDVVIRTIAARLAAAFHDGHVVARLGGDEFALVVPGLGDGMEVLSVAEALRALIAEPIALEGGLLLNVAGSVGVALAPEHGDAAEQLLQRADVAMYAAKETHTGIQVYRPALDHYSPVRLQLAGEVRDAIRRNELYLVYQPKVDLHTGVIVGVEALVRWHHPTRGIVAPSDFVPAVENTELAHPLTVHLLDLALAACRRWKDLGLDLHVAVNVPARCLADDRLVTEVPHALHRHGLDASSLEVELTESSLLADAAQARRALGALRGLGISLAIDDFGTGYASISYLTGLPVHVVKIDQSFVLHLHDDPQAAAVTRFSIELAHGLGLTVVAEGVEDEATLQTLRSLGCDLVQGYHLARPMEEPQLVAWLASANTRITAAVGGQDS
jgi:diguanylate cyclase (GGDEF)-like protein